MIITPTLAIRLFPEIIQRKKDWRGGDDICGGISEGKIILIICHLDSFVASNYLTSKKHHLL